MGVEPVRSAFRFRFGAEPLMSQVAAVSYDLAKKTIGASFRSGTGVAEALINLEPRLVLDEVSPQSADVLTRLIFYQCQLIAHTASYDYSLVDIVRHDCLISFGKVEAFDAI